MSTSMLNFILMVVHAKLLCPQQKIFWALKGKELNVTASRELFTRARLVHSTPNSTFFKAKYAQRPVYVQRLLFTDKKSLAAARKHIELLRALQKTEAVLHLYDCFEGQNFFALIVDTFEVTGDVAVERFFKNKFEDELDSFIATAQTLSVLHRNDIVLNLSDLRSLAYTDQFLTSMIVLDLSDTCKKKSNCPARKGLFTAPERNGAQLAQFTWDIYSLGVFFMLGEVQGDAEKLGAPIAGVIPAMRVMLNYSKLENRSLKPFSLMLGQCVKVVNRLKLPDLLLQLTEIRDQFLIAMMEVLYERNFLERYMAINRKFIQRRKSRLGEISVI